MSLLCVGQEGEKAILVTATSRCVVAVNGATYPVFVPSFLFRTQFLRDNGAVIVRLWSLRLIRHLLQHVGPSALKAHHS
jgi:hypothetical protein